MIEYRNTVILKSADIVFEVVNSFRAIDKALCCKAQEGKLETTLGE
jgi:hypothetical protein